MAAGVDPSDFEAVTRRVRRTICEASAALTEVLYESGTLIPGAARELHAVGDTEGLLTLLDALRPDMF